MAQFIFNSLEDAIKSAGYGTLYIYVAHNLHEGWLESARIPQLRWYEKLIHVDRSSSSGFLSEIRSDEDFELIAIGQSFVLFTAQNETELLEGMNLTRPWVETFIRSDISDGLIDPATFRFPPAIDDANP